MLLQKKDEEGDTKNVDGNDLISIVMPVYNCEKFLNETIVSVLKQTYDNWELLLIDDASTDRSAEIIYKYLNNEKRIVYVKLQENKGAAYARNKGIEYSKGQYIAFLDSDDLWLPEKLERQYCFMKKNHILFSCCYYEQINEDGMKTGKVIRSQKKVNYKGALKCNPIGTLTAMYNAEKVGKVYGPNIRKRNDYALWLKLLRQVEYVNCLDEVLALYRIRKCSLSRNKLSLIRYHWELYRKYEKLSIVSAIYHIVYLVFVKLLRIK